MALTNVDAVNLTVAITAKLLNPGLKVMCRGESHEVEANMRSFGTDAVIDPYDSFASHLALALHFPFLHRLTDRLADITGHHQGTSTDPPRGQWVLCGFGRFGKAIYKRLQYEGIPTSIVDPSPEAIAHEENGVVGRGTEVIALRAAQVDKAVGIVAGTHDDASNLSILVTARELNPKVFTVARQNRRCNQPIFDAVHADIVMRKGEIVAERIRVMLTMPFLTEFLRAIRGEREPWAEELLDRINALVGDNPLRVWEVTLERDQAHAVEAALAAGTEVLLSHLMADMTDRDRRLTCLPLMLWRGEERLVLPVPETALAIKDGLLFCGTSRAARAMAWTLQNNVVLRYILSGETRPQGTLWRWLANYKQPA